MHRLGPPGAGGCGMPQLASDPESGRRAGSVAGPRGGDALILPLPGRRRISCRAVALDVERIAALADRPVEALTPRDVAPALLASPPAEALTAIPGPRAPPPA